MLGEGDLITIDDEGYITIAENEQDAFGKIVDFFGVPCIKFKGDTKLYPLYKFSIRC